MASLRDVLPQVLALTAAKGMPRRYLSLDTETSGLSLKDDFVVQFGYSIVNDGKIVNIGSFYICPTIQGKIMNPRASEINGITDEKLRKEGMDPRTAFSEVVDLIKAASTGTSLLAGHNLFKFDCNILESEFKRHGISFQFDRNRLFDVGLIEKALRINTKPKEGEILQKFYKRVSSAYSRGVRWSLDRILIPTYGIDKSAELDVNNLHDAAEDAKAVCLIIEEWRKLMGGK